MTYSKRVFTTLNGTGSSRPSNGGRAVTILQIRTNRNKPPIRQTCSPLPDRSRLLAAKFDRRQAGQLFVLILTLRSVLRQGHWPP
jgi:hypothetical protein